MLYVYSRLSWRKVVVFLLLFLFIVGVYQSSLKKLPEGVSVEGEVFQVLDEDIVFLSDETYINAEGERLVEQTIFDQVFDMISNAKKYIVVDMFLFNDYQGVKKESTRSLSKELTETLITKKESLPDIVITVVSDPINTIYEGQELKYFKQLEDAGITVVVTNLKPLRDSNPIYSSFWRTFIQWFGNNNIKGFLIHPFQHDGYLVTIRSYLSLLNFKANHRKLIVADNGNGEVYTLVTSANPHDGSSAHGNVALVVKSSIWKDAIESERAVGYFSGVTIPSYEKVFEDEKGSVAVQLLTESKIKKRLVGEIETLQEGDSLDMAVFYLSDRDVVKALKEADSRGVILRILLDPNKDAFGHEKNGVPNRPVADELLSNSIGNTSLRWCDTHGEQCHAKLTLFTFVETNSESLLLGSANFTRRNIADYNLETNIFVAGRDVRAIADAKEYFERLWNNEDDRQYTVSYDVYKEESFLKTILYRFMEELGTSTF